MKTFLCMNAFVFFKYVEATTVYHVGIWSYDPLLQSPRWHAEKMNTLEDKQTYFVIIRGNSYFCQLPNGSPLHRYVNCFRYVVPLK
jgi:hypothetical protein